MSVLLYGSSELPDIARLNFPIYGYPELQLHDSLDADVPTFLKRLMNITGMSEQCVVAQIKEKGDSKCIPWKSLEDLILVHPDTRKRVDVFAFSIYGLVIFPKALGHIDDIVLDLFDQLDKRKVEKVSYLVFSEEYSPLKEFVAIPRQGNVSEEKWMTILQR
ncbi:hypothetical protein Gohar_028025 [Gossypium harknessii]|uniref:Uncharacterized protein n=1 Tax=Gossypium harknessii TaxID=34285 RepID=A0A7J9IE69_9ROSI|nr:hypothetical protein [Gossypium harknessii]